MSDNFRVVECLYTPSELFCIYDYTKIAYLAGNYLCVREVVSHDVSPSFIKLGIQNLELGGESRYFKLIAFPNLLVLAEKTNTRDVYLHFFSASEEQQLKVFSELAKKADSQSELQYNLYQSQANIYLVIQRGSDSEVIVVSSSRREVITRGFVSGQISEFKAKTFQSLQQFSILHHENKEVVEYQLIHSKAEDHQLKIAQKNRYSLASKNALVVWSKDELIVAIGNQIKVYLDGKEIQELEISKPVKMITSLIGGFLVVAGNSIRIYRKSVSVYDLEGEYSLEEMPTSKIQLSPQQDLIAFYSEKTEAIYWSFNWEAHQQGRVKEIAFSKIELHKEENIIKAYPSSQSIFALTSGSIINIYSPITYHCYLSLRASIREAFKPLDRRKVQRSLTLAPDRGLSQLNLGQPIETLVIHPVKPMLVIAYKSLIRVYLVLYNQIKMVKQITLAHCKGLGFNNSGSVLYAKLAGKQGSKIYLYNSNNFEPIEVISTSRPVIDILWTPYDTAVYAVHSNGFYSWTLDSLFKQKSDSTFNFKFDIKGASIYNGNLLFWGSQNILEMDFSQNIIESIKIHHPIDQLLVQKNQIIVSLVNGELHRCKSLDHLQSSLLSAGFKTYPGSKLYPIKGNTLLCMNGEGNILCLEWGADEKSSLQLVAIERKKLIRFQQSYRQYQEQIRDINDKMQTRLQLLSEQFVKRQQRQREEFERELCDREQRYRSIREEKLKIEEKMQENMEIHQENVLKQVKELERIYERKLALTTNKLLTSDEIAFRNNLIAKENLVKLEYNHAENIQKVRSQYGKALEKEVNFRSTGKEELLTMKKQYETRLSQLEMQNEELLKKFQNLNENNIVNLKKNVVNLELKYSEAISQKYNLEKSFTNERVLLQQLQAKNDYLSDRLEEEQRRNEQLSGQNTRMQAQLVQKDETIACLQSRISELQKSNQIFKYRIIQIKNISDPKEDEILKLKDNMIELEEEYDKMSKKAHELEQHLSLIKKDNQQLKSALTLATHKQQKIDKNYSSLTDRLREITKAPIQQIRRSLLKLLEQFERAADSNKETAENFQDGPLEELNRVRDHLEICLKEAVDSGKKNEKQKETQVKRKNKENSELLKQINDLRVKVSDLQGKLKERDLELQELRRERRLHSSATKPTRERASTHGQTQVQRNHTRESFFEKSMFRGHWKDKRLRTQQGSRKKSNQSHVRYETNHLYIQSRAEQIQQLKRVLQQKEVIIKQLINKIHKLS